MITPVLDARNYYGMASDYLRTDTSHLTMSHIHRFDGQSRIQTTLRQGHYERDLLGSANRFVSGTTLENAAWAAINRSPKGRRGASDITQVQSDYQGQHQAWGHEHLWLAGVEVYAENAVRNNSTALGLVNSPTLASTPNDGASSTGTRDPLTQAMGHFQTRSIGWYAQDTVRLTSTVQLVGGLRWDQFKADYLNLSQQPFQMKDYLLSPRLGALWKPDGRSTYYTSWGESYNTQGDTYQWTPSSASGALSGNNLKWLNTPPEKSRNLEVGSKFSLLEDQALLGLAWFHSEKFNERNLDEPTASNYLLSGKRHAAGLEFNFAGRITPRWEMLYNHNWIPDAQVVAIPRSRGGDGHVWLPPF